MFSQGCVKNSVRGLLFTPPLADSPPRPRDGHCSGRYASYWNAVLLCTWLLVVLCINLYWIFRQMLTCHFFTIDRSLSVVRFIPWKLVRTLRLWTSSAISLNFLNAISSFCKSAREHSNTRPFNPSEAISDESVEINTCNYAWILHPLSNSRSDSGLSCVSQQFMACLSQWNGVSLRFRTGGWT